MSIRLNLSALSLPLVRYFGAGGPNKASSFHAIGEIFDKGYAEGSISRVRHDVQTTLVAPGGAAIVDFKLDYPPLDADDGPNAL